MVVRTSISLQSDVRDRLDRVVAMLPGSSRSAFVNEILELVLPDLEEMYGMVMSARDEHGALDQGEARERLATWVGLRLMRMTEPDEEGNESG